MFRRFFARVIAPILMILLGIVFVFGGNKILERNREFSKTTAIIESITEDYDVIEEEYTHEVIVSYTVDGKGYSEKLGAYRSSYAVGQEVEISYDPHDPSDIQSAGAAPGYIFIGLGIFSGLAGIFLLVKNIIQGI